MTSAGQEQPITAPHCPAPAYLPSMPLCSSCRVTQLTEELLQRRRQEEKEAQDLENMVHSVEQNLQLMTVRRRTVLMVDLTERDRCLV